MSTSPNTSQSPTSSSVQSPTMLSAQPKKGVASRRLRALLAGGLVLGVGASITLATWNDSEFATGTFKAGHFNMQGNLLDNDTFTEHPTDAKAALSFTTDVVGNLSPNDIVAAPFVLRLDEATTTNASVTIEAATLASDTTGGHLTYGVSVVTAYADCVPTPTNVVSTPVEANTSFGGATTGTFSLNKGLTSAAGANVYLCLLVTADSTLIQDSTATATWTFSAVSVDPAAV